MRKPRAPARCAPPCKPASSASASPLSDKFGYVYAYEVDGLGHTNLMDDANIPSLLASPYMSYSSPGDLVYQNTRRFVLSSDNPYYFTGKYASGVGSPHTPKGYVWPLALVAQGLTAQSVEERNAMLAMLLASDPGDHLLHESFDPNDPKQFTRVDFDWPNALFVDFVMVDYEGLQPLPDTKSIGPLPAGYPPAAPAPGPAPATLAPAPAPQSAPSR